MTARSKGLSKNSFNMTRCVCVGGGGGGVLVRIWMGQLKIFNMYASISKDSPPLHTILYQIESPNFVTPKLFPKPPPSWCVHLKIFRAPSPLSFNWYLNFAYSVVIKDHSCLALDCLSDYFRILKYLFLF